MHVAVDPDGRAGLLGVAADGQQRNVPARGALADGTEVRDVGVSTCPGAELIEDLCVIEVPVAEHPVSWRVADSSSMLPESSCHA